MKRDIKFRVWHKIHKEWVTSGSIFENFLDSNPYDFTDICGDDYIIQQYTGLKDINRKEIYEGDIVNETHYGSHDCSGFKLVSSTPTDPYEYIGVVGWTSFNGACSGYSASNLDDNWNDAYDIGWRTYPLITTLGQTTGNRIKRNAEVIGNIFENIELLKNI